MELSVQLKSWRNKNGWTQKDLAEKLNVSDKTISSWKTGRTYPDISMLLNLSELFNISLDEFMRGDSKMIKKIDKDLKLTKTYKLFLIIGVTLILCIAFF
ncbi:helix-turn-helix domain-containing protein [Melissococcus plutonius]|nr:helix-turn-helix transcriptional regulator [Melissococcus plutonius]